MAQQQTDRIDRVLDALNDVDGFEVDDQLRRQAAAGDLDDLVRVFARARRRLGPGRCWADLTASA